MVTTYDDLQALQRHHPAWRLLRADNAPLILSFLGRVFSEENVRSISASELTARLAGTLADHAATYGDDAFPRPAREYLDTWASPDHGWLRKYYPVGQTEAFFDATPDVERALAWVASLQVRDFVGTQSRLNTILDLLRQMAVESQTDPDVRLADLEQRRAALDEQIALVRAGEVRVLDRAQLRDRYQQFATTARGLLADFREVEGNFRTLDRALREQITAWAGSKADLLDGVVGDRRSIQESDQGRSFLAFFDFLLASDRQAEFTDLLERVQQLPELEDADSRLDRIYDDWLDACQATQATVRLLSEQLRRFLDDRALAENRRVAELLRGIESAALRLREEPATSQLRMQIDALRAEVVLPMERPLYTEPPRSAIDSRAPDRAEAGDLTALLDVTSVDAERLAAGVRKALQRRGQVGLGEVLADDPLQEGLAELLAYLGLDAPDVEVVFDEQSRLGVEWTDPDGVVRHAWLPGVTFVRRLPGAAAPSPERRR